MCWFTYFSFVFVEILKDVKDKDVFLKQSAANHQSRPFVRRALFTVGLLLRHFDFTDKDVIEGLDVSL